MKIGDVVNFATAVQALLDTVGISAPVKAFSPAPGGIGGSWEALVFTPALAAVSGMVITDGLDELSVGDTKLRNGYMEQEVPIMAGLEYNIEACIAAGTITDSFMSFQTGAFKLSIRRHNIGDFHTHYVAMMARINFGIGSPNKAALIASGFTLPMITSITTAHDLAWGMNTTKIDLTAAISTLSGGNKILVDTLLKLCQKIIDAIHAWAESTGNKTLMKKATHDAILKTVAATPAKKPRNREIKMNTSICWLQDPPARDLLQFTLITKGGSASVCRMNTKTGVCSAGIPLVYGVMTSIKKKDIPGTGDCIIITNTGSGTIKVTVFIVKG
jgi:hypothetical protein